MRTLLAMIMAVSLCATAAAQERPRPYTKVEGWRVASLVKDGKFGGCAAGIDQPDGTTFFIGYGGRWWLGLANAAWDGRGERKLPVRILVDGQPMGNVTATQKGRLVSMDFGESRERIVAFITGKAITLVTPMGRSTFGLAGSFKATAALMECVKGRGQGGEIASGAGNGAFGPAATSTGRSARPGTLAPRAQTLDLATSYLAKLGTPYTVLEPGANILKNFPVNWTFPDGGFGGMAIYAAATTDGQKFFDNFVADNARLCRGTSALKREDPTQAEQQITRFRAIGTCEEGSSSYLTDFTLLAGPQILVAIINVGTLGAPDTEKRMDQQRKWSL